MHNDHLPPPDLRRSAGQPGTANPPSDCDRDGVETADARRWEYEAAAEAFFVERFGRPVRDFPRDEWDDQQMIDFLVGWMQTCE